MIRYAGGTARLRPHVKTHKMPDVIRLQLAAGITKFKCATLAEAEMVAQCGAPDVLLAYQLLGPKVARFAQLIKAYPQTAFSTIVDDEGAIRALSQGLSAAGVEAEVLLDIDNGMHRTGIAPGTAAAALYRLIDRIARPHRRADSTSTTASIGRATSPNARPAAMRPSPRSLTLRQRARRGRAGGAAAWSPAARRRFPSMPGMRIASAAPARACSGTPATAASSPIWTSCTRRWS